MSGRGLGGGRVSARAFPARALTRREWAAQPGRVARMRAALEAAARAAAHPALAAVAADLARELRRLNGGAGPTGAGGSRPDRARATRARLEQAWRDHSGCC
jgi:hypothetical protein